MNKKANHENLLTPFEKLIYEDFLAKLQKELLAEVAHMNEIIQIAHELEKKPEEEKEAHQADINNRIHQILDHIWEVPNEQSFEENYADLISSIYEETEKPTRFDVEEQSYQNFRIQPGDKFWVQISKPVKRLLWFLSRVPAHVANVFRKKKKTITFWNHMVPVQGLLRRHYRSLLANDLIKVTDQYYLALILQYQELKNWQEEHLSIEPGSKISRHSIHLSIEEFKSKALMDIHEASEKALKERSASFNQEWIKIDTLELSLRVVSETYLEKTERLTDKKWQQRDLQWRNALYAFFEDWRSDLDLYALKHHVQSELQAFDHAQDTKIKEFLLPDIMAIRKFIVDHSRINPKEPLPKELKRIHYQTTKQLDESMVPELVDKLGSQSIVNLLNKLELEIVQHVQNLSEEHIIVKNGKYDQPMNEEDFYSVSINELVTFELLVNFQKAIKERKSQLFGVLNEMAANAQDIDHIITFSISSALSSLEEGQSEEDAIQIAKDGIERAEGRIEEIEAGLKNLTLENQRILKEAADVFNVGIMDLCHNESISELRLRITKAKAAQQAKQVRSRVKDQAKERGTKVWLVLKENANRSTEWFQRLSGQFILTAGKPELTKQVSDFLHESQQAINKLPLIYQRLYEIEPLEDLELFEGREQEFEQIKKAFENWKLGRYAATVVLGEKWGGLTTFINYTEKKARFSHKITRHEWEGNINSQEEFVKKLAEILDAPSLESFEAIQSHLLEGPKRVMILEDLQNLYLRKVGGFGAIEMLGRLIASTGHHVFWLCTSTIYTWNYLSKSIQINEYFSYEIKLSELKKEQIVNLIWKRNRISGFNITFEADENIAKDKKFQKLTTEEQQLKLREDYFQELNGFAKSNVSMALLFWLLSTREMDANQITIGYFEKPNLNFLKSLSAIKVYVLHALIMHDGLRKDQLSQVMRCSQEEMQMVLSALREDGIVQYVEGMFMINPVIYRGVINLLISKNLIH